MRTKSGIKTLFLIVALMTSCQKQKGNPAPPASVTASIQDVSSDGCINIQKLQTFISKVGFAFPALIVTTNYTNDDDDGRALDFDRAVSFSLDKHPINDFEFLKSPLQAACSSVYSKTASGQNLEFKVESVSTHSLSFKLTESFDDKVKIYKQEALALKKQPIAYAITHISDTHWRILTTYRTFDPHCRSKKARLASIQKDLLWAESESDLPVQVQINEIFLSQIQLARDAQPIVTSAGESGYVLASVSDLQALDKLRIKEALLTCQK